MDKKQKFLITAMLVIINLVLASCITYAWTEPSQAPPGGNVATPLNVSSNDQTKTGSISVGPSLTIGYGQTGGNLYLADSSSEEGDISRADQIYGLNDLRLGGDSDFTGESDSNSDLYIASSGNISIPNGPLSLNGNQINMGDGNVGGGDTQGVRKVNFENHEWADFACTDNDDSAGSLFYDRSEGLALCRQGTIEELAHKSWVNANDDYAANTDTQDLSIDSTNVNDVISLTNGGSVTIQDDTGDGGCSNVWETFNSDSGSVAASGCNDTLTVSGDSGISTSISGSTLTITNTGTINCSDCDSRFVNVSGDTMTGDLTLDDTTLWGDDVVLGYNATHGIASAGDLVIKDSNGNITLDLDGASGNLTVGGNTTFNGVTYTWPSSDGSSDQVLTTNGSGGLSWSTVSGGISNAFAQVANSGGTVQFSASGEDQLRFGGSGATSVSFNSSTNMVTFSSTDNYEADTDTQDLSIDSTNINDVISLTNGGSITIQDNYEANTDTQDLSIDSSSANDIISLTNGGSVTIQDDTVDGCSGCLDIGTEVNDPGGLADGDDYEADTHGSLSCTNATTSISLPDGWSGDKYGPSCPSGKTLMSVGANVSHAADGKFWLNCYKSSSGEYSYCSFNNNSGFDKNPTIIAVCCEID